MTELDIFDYYKLVDALYHSMQVSVNTDDPTNVWKYNGYKHFARKYNQLIKEIAQKIPISPVFDYIETDKLPSNMDTLPPQQKDIFFLIFTNVAFIRSYLEEKLNIKDNEMIAIEDFIKSKLRSTFYSEPKTENEVQNNIERLFLGKGFIKGQDYDREVGRVKISSKEVVPDFIFPQLSLAIEVKLIKSKSRITSIIDELNADISTYNKKYDNFLIIVYDLGFIRDAVEFRQDIEDLTHTRLVIVKH